MTIEKIHLSLKASNLMNVASGRRKISDPYATVSLSLSSKQNADKMMLGKTEVINNTLNPDWVKTFTINHDPMGQAYFVNVNVLDFESNDKIMGMSTFQLESILSNEGNTRTFNLLNGGMLHVRAEKAIGTGTLVLRMSGIKLKNTEGMFRKSDPFYQFVRRDMGEKGPEFNIVHRSQPIMNNLSPDWPEERISISQLCQGDLKRPLQLTILDYEKNGQHVPMGGIEITVAKLMAKFQTKRFSFDIQKKKKVTGKIYLHWVDITEDD